jgi:plasmid maintenance system antidote protein VapI
MNQVAIPVEVRPEEVARKTTLGHAMELCAELAGFSLDKELQHKIGVDKAQFSRWMAGTEGIVWPKFTKLMDECGNDAPLLWMLHQRGYDLHSLRKRESETEKQLRLAREENAALRRVLAGATA